MKKQESELPFRYASRQCSAQCHPSKLLALLTLSSACSRDFSHICWSYAPICIRKIQQTQIIWPCNTETPLTHSKGTVSWYITFSWYHAILAILVIRCGPRACSQVISQAPRQKVSDCDTSFHQTERSQWHRDAWWERHTQQFAERWTSHCIVTSMCIMSNEIKRAATKLYIKEIVVNLHFILDFIADKVRNTESQTATSHKLYESLLLG